MAANFTTDLTPPPPDPPLPPDPPPPSPLELELELDDDDEPLPLDEDELLLDEELPVVFVVEPSEHATSTKGKQDARTMAKCRSVVDMVVDGSCSDCACEGSYRRSCVFTPPSDRPHSPGFRCDEDVC